MTTSPRIRAALLGWQVHLLALSCGAVVGDVFGPIAGDRVDLAAFGQPLPAPDCGLEWTGPIRVDEVRARPPGNETIADWRLE